jgi:hypothetical protein
MAMTISERVNKTLFIEVVMIVNGVNEIKDELDVV